MRTCDSRMTKKLKGLVHYVPEYVHLKGVPLGPTSEIRCFLLHSEFCKIVGCNEARFGFREQRAAFGKKMYQKDWKSRLRREKGIIFHKFSVRNSGASSGDVRKLRNFGKNYTFFPTQP